MLRPALLLAVLCACTGSVAPRDRPPSIADPAFLEQYAETYRFRLGQPSSIKVTPDGGTVLFLRSGPRAFVRDLYAFDVASGRERTLLTAEQILAGAEEKLSVDELARRERMRLAARGIATYDLSKDGARILVPLSGRLFVLERASGKVKELASDAGYPLDPQLSPDGSRVAVARDGDLYVLDVASGREIRLTTKTSETVTNGLAEFVAQEEMDRHHGTWWSPDGRVLAYQQTDVAGVETMHILDPMFPTKPPQSWPFPRAGTKNADVRLGLIPVQGGRTTWVKWDRRAYPYLATVKWTENAPLTLVVQNRKQTEELVLTVDTATGATKILLTERDDAWLNLDQDVPRWLPDGSAFLWTTERNGARQLELRGSSGELLSTLTPPEPGFRRLLEVDADGGFVMYTGSPTQPEQHLYRARFREPLGSPTRLTDAAGIHGAEVSDKHDIFVQTSSLLTGQTRFAVRRSDGSPVGELTSVAEKPAFETSLELVTVGEDPTFHALIIRPRNFEAGRRYPVIVYVYGGPHWNVVSAAPQYFRLQQWMADHGFIVVVIDGRGTPYRGRAWERSIKGSFVDVPLADQVAGLRALGARFPAMDLDRVGIFGWSYGGYLSAMAVMREPEVYRTAVAGAPAADFRDYDTHYTERYLGLPDENPDGYHKSSVLTYASQLERPLLIVHGTADDNVYFLHSLKISDALFRAGKHHELLPLSGFTHMVPDPEVTTRLYTRIMEHFVTHL